MEPKIFKVHRNGRVYFATYLGGVYVERASLEALKETISVRENFKKIFARVDFFGKGGLQ